MVCLHGVLDTWRTWELVLPALERHHEVLAPTLAGHAGGPPLPDEVSDAALADAVELAMDEAGFRTAHLVGNSLGGWVALQLAARGRARTVVAFAPAGGWAQGDESWRDLLRFQAEMREMVKDAAPYAEAILSTPEGRRRATRLLTVEYEHIPTELMAHQMRAVAAAEESAVLIDAGLRAGEWSLDAERIGCPVRVVWGAEDKLLPWPQAAQRFRTDWLPQADWVVLDGVGHAPQLDVPLEASQMIVYFTGE